MELAPGLEICVPVCVKKIVAFFKKITPLVTGFGLHKRSICLIYQTQRGFFNFLTVDQGRTMHGKFVLTTKAFILGFLMNQIVLTEKIMEFVTSFIHSFFVFIATNLPSLRVTISDMERKLLNSWINPSRTNSP